jgi:hypothetical protein
MQGESYQVKNLAANAATTVKSGSGKCHALTINKAGASSNVISVYDGTDTNGTLLATIDGTAAAGSTFLRNARFVTGLHVVIATGTAADITIEYE